MTRCVFQRWWEHVDVTQAERESVCTGRKEHEETRREERGGCSWKACGVEKGRGRGVRVWVHGQRVGREWAEGAESGSRGALVAERGALGRVSQGMWDHGQARQSLCVCVSVCLCVCVCVCLCVRAREQRGTETTFAPYAQVLLRSVRPHGGMRGPGFPEADNKRLI
jgi:hypothetical protein